MVTNSFSKFAVLPLLFAVASCSSLSKDGPETRALVSGAATSVSSSNQSVNIDYALIDINSETLKYFGSDAASDSSAKSSFGVVGSRPPEQKLGVGDIISITIFEAQSGGLFIPSDAGSRPGNYISLPNQTIPANGAINVPYAGSIKIAGRTSADVEKEIVTKLLNRAIEPQVLITTVATNSSLATVVGDVNSPKSISLSAGGDRILDAIARAGGLSSNGQESSVSLQRNGRKATMLYADILKDPKENVYLLPGDTLSVTRNKRTYFVFGATNSAAFGVSGAIDFAESNVNLSEAISRSAGLTDSRADAAQVFVYRVVDRKMVEKAGVDLTKFGSETSIPVVFHASVRDPAGFFAMSKFPLQDRDVLYVGSSDAAEMTKLLTFARTVSSDSANILTDGLSIHSTARTITNYKHY